MAWMPSGARRDARNAPKTAKRAPNTAKRLASIANAYADVSTKTIRRYIADGRLTGYRVGPRLVKVDLADLDALVQSIPTAGC